VLKRNEKDMCLQSLWIRIQRLEEVIGRGVHDMPELRRLKSGPRHPCAAAVAICGVNEDRGAAGRNNQSISIAGVQARSASEWSVCVCL
jgi:hypothetical protein